MFAYYLFSDQWPYLKFHTDDFSVCIILHDPYRKKSLYQIQPEPIHNIQQPSYVYCIYWIEKHKKAHIEKWKRFSHVNSFLYFECFLSFCFDKNKIYIKRPIFIFIKKQKENLFKDSNTQMSVNYRTKRKCYIDTRLYSYI